MSRAFRFLLIAGLLAVGIVAILTLAGRSRNRSALAKYKAELRAQGEKLSAAELGYPRLPDPNASLDQLQAGVNQLGTPTWQNAALEMMRFVAAGRAQVCWSLPQPLFSTRSSPTNLGSWEEFADYFADHADGLAQLRAATENPPRRFHHNPTNWFGSSRPPFIAMRKGVQSLAGDAIAALRAHELDRAQADIRALAQLSQCFRDDPFLVCQMVRMAIAGLGLSGTWEALQTKGWSESNLEALQKTWEAVDFTDVFEKSITGERTFGEAAFSSMRSADSKGRAMIFNGGASPNSAEDYFMQFVALPLWRANSEADELLYYRHLQRSLEAYRQLQTGVSMSEVNRQIGANVKEFEATLSGPFSKYQYLFSSIAIPNYIRAASMCAHNETQRRLTITAIAIDRYRLRNGHPPSDLNALVPEFLSAVTVDLMSAKPMGYKLNADGSFTLYSVGEDGRDDGGDPSSPGVTNKFDLWSGKDAVWPRAVFETEPAN